MTDDLPHATPDFAAFRELLALVSNAKKSEQLLSSLERRLVDVQKAEARLEAARKTHDQEVALELGELEAKRKKLLDKEINLRDREGRLAANQELVDRAKAELREQHGERFFNGLTQEPA